MPKSKAVKRNEALGRVENTLYGAADFLAQGSNTRFARGFSHLEHCVDEANKIRRAIGIPLLWIDIAAFNDGQVLIMYQGTINQELFYRPVKEQNA